MDLPGLRKDAPGRVGRVRARLPDLSSLREWRQEALDELEKDRSADTTRSSDESRWRTILKILSSWGLEPFPPTYVSFRALAATLKKAKYSSAAIYLSVYRRRCERSGHMVDHTLGRTIGDYVRSCERGLGGPARPRPIPMELLPQLPASRSAWNAGGPINPRAAISAGCWFLCREVELSTSRARNLEFSMVGDALTVTWHLPASKNDQAALGYARTLRCSCEADACARRVRAGCAAHVLLDHAHFLRIRFPERWSQEGPEWSLPLFPDGSGTVVSKQAMVETIRSAARSLGVPLTSPDGTERVTGHSLRVSGAQGPIKLGWHPWAVQLQGRWESDVVKRYIRDSPLDAARAVPSKAGPSLDLEHLVAMIVEKIGRTKDVPPDMVPKCAGQGFPPLFRYRHL